MKTNNLLQNTKSSDTIIFLIFFTTVKILNCDQY